MPDFWSDCSAFVNRHICKILITLSVAVFSVLVSGATWYVVAQDQLDRLTQATDSRSVGNMQSIDALTGEVRKIGEAVGEIQGDIKVLKDRSDRSARAVYEGMPYTARPE